MVKTKWCNAALPSANQIEMVLSNWFLRVSFIAENLVIRSEPFPEGSTSSPSLPTSEENANESNQPLSGNTAELKTVPAKDSTNNANSSAKKASLEKKTSDDGDDPFGALDWKDGIATLPGNCLISNGNP